MTTRWRTTTWRRPVMPRVLWLVSLRLILEGSCLMSSAFPDLFCTASMGSFQVKIRHGVLYISVMVGHQEPGA